MKDEEIEVLIERLEEDEQGLPSLEAAEALRQLHDKVKAQQARHNAMIDLCNQTDRMYLEAKARADALEDEVKALREGWQPIETAPKDGRFILAYDALSYWPDLVSESFWIAQWSGEGWEILLDGQKCSPTHWMPLPPPPEES